MATYYAINAGGNWSAGGTWSTISAKDGTRVGNGATPTSTDTCILDDYSGNVTVSAASAAGVVDCTSNGTYAGTLTFNVSQTLTVSGNVTLSGSMTISGTGTLAFGANGTLTTNGKTISCALNLGTSRTITLGDNCTVAGNITNTTATTLNSNTLYLTTGGTLGTTGTLGGSSAIQVNAGTVNATGAVSLNTTLAGGSITMTAFNLGTATFTYSTGTLSGNWTLTVTGTSTITGFVNATSYIHNVTFAAGAKTVTLGSLLYCRSAMTFGTGAVTFSGAYDIYVGNTLTFSGAATHTLSGNITGTTGGTGGVPNGITVNTGNVVINGAYTIYNAAGLSLTAVSMSGTATIDFRATVNGYAWIGSTTAAVVNNNVSINLGAANTLTTNTAYYGTGTLSLVSGTTVTGAINIRSSCTINTAAGKSFGAITIGAASTVTLTSNLSCGALTCSAALTLAGSYDVACTSFVHAAATTSNFNNRTIDVNGTMTFQTGNAIINSGSFTVSGGLTMTGVSATGSANITMDGTGTISSSSSAAIIYLPITINTAGTITLGTSVYPAYDGSYPTTSGRWVYTAGTLTVTGSTIYSAALYFNGFTGSAALNNLTINGNGTYFLLSNLAVNGTLAHAYAGTHVIDGAYTITAANFTCQNEISFKNGADLNVTGTFTANNTLTAISVQSVGSTLTVANLVINSAATLTLRYITGYQDVTLNVTNLITVDGTKASTTTLRGYNGSLGAGRTQYLNYSGGFPNCQIYELTASYIDASSSAVPIYSWYGAATNCTNVYAVTGADIDLTPGGSGGSMISVVNF